MPLRSRPWQLRLLRLIKLDCGSFLREMYSILLYLRCFTASTMNIGEFVDIFKPSERLESHSCVIISEK